MTEAMPPPPRAVFQVGELVTTLKHALEMNFPALWVQGEISNFVSARSGHWYFTLKDNQAQIRCAFFKYQRGRRPEPANGQQVLVHGRATLFPARGELQLVLDDLEDAGAGALHLAFERLKRKLEAEGLFAESRKQALPPRIGSIGILSSPAGAAIHDVLTTLRRRNPLLRAILYPVPVQGTDAVPAMLRMLRAAIRRKECDVLLLTRGGGSLEDLMAFNDEALARELAECPLPVVSAVGHEVDFSITDFIADVRAATPTAAAELLSTDQRGWLEQLARQGRTLQQILIRRLQRERQDLEQRRQRLQRLSPQRRLAERAQLLDSLQGRLGQHLTRTLHGARRELHARIQGLQAQRILRLLELRRVERRRLEHSLRLLQARELQQARGRLQTLTDRLAELSPERTLSRGYAIVWRGDTILRVPEDAGTAKLRLQLASGNVWARACEPE